MPQVEVRLHSFNRFNDICRNCGATRAQYEDGESPVCLGAPPTSAEVIDSNREREEALLRPSIRYCRDCAHCVMTYAQSAHEWECRRETGFTSLVTGEPDYVLLNCRDERRASSTLEHCGATGRFWRQIPTLSSTQDFGAGTSTTVLASANVRGGALGRSDIVNANIGVDVERPRTLNQPRFMRRPPRPDGQTFTDSEAEDL